MNTVTDFYSKPSHMSAYTVYEKARSVKQIGGFFVGNARDLDRRYRAHQATARKNVFFLEHLMRGLASGIIQHKKAKQQLN